MKKILFFEYESFLLVFGGVEPWQGCKRENTFQIQYVHIIKDSHGVYKRSTIELGVVT